MAKYELRLRARALRKQGNSLGSIAQQLMTSKGTVSFWCRDIALTEQQVAVLLANKRNGAKIGQLMGAATNKRKRFEKIEKYKEEGRKRLGVITNENLLIAGLSLYLGEGFKKARKVGFTNSDPKIIKFVMRWLEECFNVTREQLMASVLINEMHRYREREVVDYWARIMNLPMSQFRKTRYARVKNKKVYENNDTYFGTLTIVVLKSSDLFYRIQGLMDALLESKGRGSSTGESVGIITPRLGVRVSPPAQK